MHKHTQTEGFFVTNKLNYIIWFYSLFFSFNKDTWKLYQVNVNIKFTFLNGFRIFHGMNLPVCLHVPILIVFTFVLGLFSRISNGHEYIGWQTFAKWFLPSGFCGQTWRSMSFPDSAAFALCFLGLWWPFALIYEFPLCNFCSFSIGLFFEM